MIILVAVAGLLLLDYLAMHFGADSRDHRNPSLR